MADTEGNQSIYRAENGSKAEVDHEHARVHKISREDDARIRRKVDMVVLPMVSIELVGLVLMTIG